MMFSASNLDNLVIAQFSFAQPADFGRELDKSIVFRTKSCPGLAHGIQAPAPDITLLIDVGTSGQLTLDESSRDVQYARPILDLLNRLPQWKPATLDGQPVPGRLTVEMEIGLGMVSSRVVPSVKNPVPLLKAVAK